MYLSKVPGFFIRCQKGQLDTNVNGQIEFSSNLGNVLIILHSSSIFKYLWFGLLCRRLLELKVPNLYFMIECIISFSNSTINSSEVPVPFQRVTRATRGARATEFRSYGALVEQAFESVLSVPGVWFKAESSL